MNQRVEKDSSAIPPLYGRCHTHPSFGTSSRSTTTTPSSIKADPKPVPSVMDTERSTFDAFPHHASPIANAEASFMNLTSESLLKPISSLSRLETLKLYRF